MVTVTDSPTEFRAARIFSEGFRIFRRNFARFFLIAAVARLPLQIFVFGFTMQIMVQAYGDAAAGHPSPGLGLRMMMQNLRLSIAATIIGFLISMIVTGMLQYLAFQSIRGHHMGTGAAFAKVLRRLLPIIGVAIVSGIFCAIGTILLIVPGILVFIALCISLPACLIEGQGVFASLGRSRALTKGHRGQIFLVFLIFLAVFVAAAIIVGIAVTVATLILGGPIVRHVPIQQLAIQHFLNFILSSAATALFGALVAAIYYRLRMLKDGIDINDIAGVFD